MEELVVSVELVGQKVCNAGRPDWGAGTVQRVQTQTVGGAAQHRVTVQFPMGQRVLLVPPARLLAPTAAPQRAQRGWLDELAGNTLDDRLAALPDEIVNLLGSARERLLAMLPLLETPEDDKSLVRWAIAQTGVGDPLGQWTRDELQAAFERYLNQRDSLLRERYQTLRARSGWQEADALLAELSPPLRRRLLEIVDPRRL